MNFALLRDRTIFMLPRCLARLSTLFNFEYSTSCAKILQNRGMVESKVVACLSLLALFAAISEAARSGVLIVTNSADDSTGAQLAEWLRSDNEVTTVGLSSASDSGLFWRLRDESLDAVFVHAFNDHDAQWMMGLIRESAPQNTKIVLVADSGAAVSASSKLASEPEWQARVVAQRALFAAADLVLTSSEADEAALNREVPDARFFTLHRTPARLFDPRPVTTAGRNGVLLVSSTDDLASRAALRSFFSTIFPALDRFVLWSAVCA